MNAGTRVFSRILCGVEQTPESLEAVRQGVRLRAAGGSVHLVAVAQTHLVVHAELVEEIERVARESLRHALNEAGGDTSRILDGHVTPCLLSEIAQEHATLVAIGTHGHSRVAGIFLGSTATALVHEAPCSVLVARPAAQFERFPHWITLGIDGSRQSLHAAAVARSLAERFGAELRAIVATGGKPIDADGLAGRAAELGLELELVEREPTDALVAAAASADLLVVGNRGLHGIRALGSVSERVAHRASCSVLVVRGSHSSVEHGVQVGRNSSEKP